MTVASRPTYGEAIGNIVDRGGRKVVVFTDQFEKFIDDLIAEVATAAAGITQITNQQQLVEGGGGAGDDEVEPPTILVQPVTHTTVVINHLHMDSADEDQVEPMFVPGR